MTINELRVRLMYAKDFTPHRVVYYETLLIEAIKFQNAKKIKTMKRQFYYCWDCGWEGPEDEVRFNRHEDYLCPKCSAFVFDSPDSEQEIDTFSDADPGL